MHPKNRTLNLSLLATSLLSCSTTLASTLPTGAFASPSAASPASPTNSAAPLALSSKVPNVSNAPRLESPTKRALRKAGASIAANGPVAVPPEVAQVCGLVGGTAFQLAPAVVGEFGLMYVTVVDPRSGEPLHLELRPNSVRGADFKLIAHNALGQPVEIPADEPRTVLGSVTGIPDARVAGSYH
ncbi:MAG: hypothetical protein QM516_14220, partial [Limnohabitans sp.]|nr:hypothetical protein [Limnohabitans sp.]